MKMDDEVIEEGWSWEDNKLFEVALAVVDEAKPDRWEAVAAMVGGNKTADQVYTHYVSLLKDLELIESGKFDHKLIDDFDETNIPISDEEDDNRHVPELKSENLKQRRSMLLLQSANCLCSCNYKTELGINL